MVRREVVELVDDLDGKPLDDGGQTVQFSYQGVDYELDLTAKNAQKFHTALTPYVAAARRVGGRRHRATTSGARPRSSTNDREQLAQIRSWARDNGYEVSGRGRIPREIQEAFQAAH